MDKTNDININLMAIKNIFQLTFRQTIQSKRTILMLIVSYLPVFFTVYYRLAEPQELIPPNLVLYHIMIFYLLFVSILVSLFYGTAVVGDEVDNKTIVYLFTRPIPKYSIIIGKYLTYIVGVILIVVPPILINFLIISTDSDMSSDFRTTLDIFGKQLGVIILSLVVYGSIFTFFGARLRHAMIIGLLFAFGWEKIMLVVPGIVRKASIVHYLLSIFPIDPSFHEAIERVSKGTFSGVSSSIITISIVTIIFLVITVFMTYKREYKFE
ncbi:TPA: ABC transporter permease [bacterium]|nr:ABC transporter permease [bacterium]